MKIVGVTGAIGSGKSTFCDALREIYGRDIVFECDQEAKSFYDDPAFRLFIQNKFLKGESFSLKALSDVVFADKTLLRELETIIFDRLESKLDAWIQDRKNEKVVFVESAIFEKAPSIAERLDEVIVVQSSSNIERAATRDGREAESIRRRAQLQPAPKGDIVITNDGTFEDLYEKAREVLKRLDNER